ncbi:hypothetical protein [Ruminococcus bovis]|uniref:Uncharacterized protein n=1 Tax=Ruminococcus bovis TaxID=2564099 RepID=A0A4P8XXC0_9FIRM|nr:hypothetical protein [Ruminococcus bovis]QCT07811.1 hypothetical protein E5Z56_10795 [Ruminococcus bovis]
MSKKVFFISIIIVSVMVLICSFPYKETGYSFIKKVNKVLDVKVNADNIKYFSDDVGGFHGDGDTVEIIELNREDNKLFNSTIDSRWSYLEQNSEIYNFLWDSETDIDMNPIGGRLDGKIIPNQDLRFILYDIGTSRINEDIKINELMDFYFIGYSYKENMVYIQRSNI